MSLSSTAVQTLVTWLQAQRWFAGKGRQITSVEQLAEFPLRSDSQRAWQILSVNYRASEERYLVTWPTGTWQSIATEKISEMPQEWVTQPEGLAALWQQLSSDQSFAWRSQEFAEFTAAQQEANARWAPFEQSNTCVIFGERYILKLFRKLESGINPDVEIGRALAEQQFEGTVPKMHAILTYEHEGQAFTYGVIHRYLHGAKTAWDVLLEQLKAAVQVQEQQWSAALKPAHQMASALGTLTARMHTLLAKANGPDFDAESWTTADREALSTSQTEYSGKQIALLRDRLPKLPADTQPLAQLVIDRQQVLLGRFADWKSINDCGQRIRIHGDYHLGQVLVTANEANPTRQEYWAIDFEGEPARPLAERRRKRSPLQDVAGMIRSLHYAVSQTRLSHAANAAGSTWAAAAYPQLVTAFITAYDAELKIDGLLPAPHSDDRQKMLELFILEKALYELGYELLNRPHWIQVPLSGIAELIEN
jgi:maltose alpha-D-glucosyltransferase / alpha-amylase